MQRRGPFPNSSRHRSALVWTLLIAALLASLGPAGAQSRYRMTVVDGEVELPPLLGTYEPALITATAINDRGTIIAAIADETGSGNPDVFLVQPSLPIRRLDIRRPTAINEASEISGEGWGWSEGPAYLRYLDPLGASTSLVGACDVARWKAADINNRGQIVGYTTIREPICAGSWAELGSVWTTGGGREYLPPP